MKASVSGGEVKASAMEQQPVGLPCAQGAEVPFPMREHRLQRGECAWKSRD